MEFVSGGHSSFESRGGHDPCYPVHITEFSSGLWPWCDFQLIVPFCILCPKRRSNSGLQEFVVHYFSSLILGAGIQECMEDWTNFWMWECTRTGQIFGCENDLGERHGLAIVNMINFDMICVSCFRACFYTLSIFLRIPSSLRFREIINWCIANPIYQVSSAQLTCLFMMIISCWLNFAVYCNSYVTKAGVWICNIKNNVELPFDWINPCSSPGNRVGYPLKPDSSSSHQYATTTTRWCFIVPKPRFTPGVLNTVAILLYSGSLTWS